MSGLVSAAQGWPFSDSLFFEGASRTFPKTGARGRSGSPGASAARPDLTPSRAPVAPRPRGDRYASPTARARYASTRCCRTP
jgi:hypothetical protein